jgi:acetoin utilization deacetylase AcuC-like enzyme
MSDDIRDCRHPVARRAFIAASSGALAERVLRPLELFAQSADRRAAQPVLVFHDRATLAHTPSADHPESPARMLAVMSVVRRLETSGQVRIVAPRRATDDDLMLVHSPSYVLKVKSEIAQRRTTLSTGDTELSNGSMTAATAAAGAVLSAVDAVMTGRERRAFCAVRPPGHHASRERGMGFCLFNNLAIGVRHAQKTHGVDRVLVADWDVHHGNGTQAVFESDGAVLFFDTHQHPWYPGTGLRSETGTGRGRGLIVNRPFPAGSGRAEIVQAFRGELAPLADRFKPQLVMVSAGFDSRLDDPLGQFTLVDRDFADLTHIMVELASRHAGGRIVSVLEGGYSLTGLASSVGAHLESLG